MGLKIAANSLLAVLLICLLYLNGVTVIWSPTGVTCGTLGTELSYIIRYIIIDNTNKHAQCNDALKFFSSPRV